MKIAQFQSHAKGSHPEDTVHHLEVLLDQPSDKQRRPCPDCTIRCSCSRHSTTCCCGCSPECAVAPRALSSDPDRYPIEPAIVPLVYCMTDLRVIETCWSCEGHINDAGSVVKLPQVWFYSPSTVYPALIAHRLGSLRIQGVLSSEWIVSVSAFSESVHATTFLIRPIRAESDLILEALQEDIRCVASGFQAEVRRLARTMLKAS